jgi:hypothetical protein
MQAFLTAAGRRTNTKQGEPYAAVVSSRPPHAPDFHSGSTSTTASNLPTQSHDRKKQEHSMGANGVGVHWQMEHPHQVQPANTFNEIEYFEEAAGRPVRSQSTESEHTCPLCGESSESELHLE